MERGRLHYGCWGMDAPVSEYVQLWERSTVVFYEDEMTNFDCHSRHQNTAMKQNDYFVRRNNPCN